MRCVPVRVSRCRVSIPLTLCIQPARRSDGWCPAHYSTATSQNVAQRLVAGRLSVWRLHLVSGQSQSSGRASGRDSKEKQGPYRDGQGGAPCSGRRGIALPGSRFFRNIMRWTDLVDGAKRRVSSKPGFLICSAVQCSAPRRVVVRVLWGIVKVKSLLFAPPWREARAPLQGGSWSGIQPCSHDSTIIILKSTPGKPFRP